jgi:repressor LexA
LRQVGVLPPSRAFSPAGQASGSHCQFASAKTFTPKQGQYLAFIHAYTCLHRRPPAETDLQQYFRVSPPSVHQMVVTLERTGFQPRVARSIEVLLDPKHLPELL